MATSPAAVIDAERLAKIRTLFAAGTSEGVSFGLTLLESLGATAADFDAALAPPVDRAVAAVADGWLQGDEPARGEYDRYNRLVVAPRFVAQRAADHAAGRSFLELVGIPTGEFEMGSDEETKDEQPVHHVRITQPFLLGKTTVTQAQWWSVMGTLPWYGRDNMTEGPQVAASYVSWCDAVEFCTRLTQLEQASATPASGRRYRLPTEAEWEYACRAGTKTRFSFGDDETRLGEYAWFDDNAEKAGQDFAHQVGRKRPNPWGLHDMHGNVQEWCRDGYDAHYYANSPAADPPGSAAACMARVVRGGSWNCRAAACRSAFRYFNFPASRTRSLGFRVVADQG